MMPNADAAMFFAAVLLPPELNQKVLRYKQQAAEKWGCKVGLKSAAHITLVPPFWFSGNERVMVNLINQIDHPPFRIATAGFQHFGQRTLFIGVDANENLNRLQAKTMALFVSAGVVKKPDSRSFHPHITIATRDLSKTAFAEAWAMYKDVPFAETFVATGLSLLKHNGAVWEVIATKSFTAAGQAGY